MLALLILIFGIPSRIVVHAPNFSPVLSLALFGGIYLKGRQGIWVPLLLMAISDAVIGFHDTMFFTWGSILLISLIGMWLKEHKNMVNVISASLISSIIFFVVTNFGAFLTMYSQTYAGLKECYLLAIPFYRSTLASTLVYSVILYAGYEWLLRRGQGTALIKFL